MATAWHRLDSVVRSSEAEFRAKVAKVTAAQFAPKIEAAYDWKLPAQYMEKQQPAERSIETRSGGSCLGSRYEYTRFRNVRPRW